MEKQVAGTLTQNWRVGPSFKKTCEETTQTIAVSQVRVQIEDSNGRVVQSLQLHYGVHSFILNGSALEYRKGIDSQAIFEINVDTSASFFVNLSQREMVKLNGEGSSWSRLSQGDRIVAGTQVLVFQNLKENQKRLYGKSVLRVGSSRFLWVSLGIVICMLSAYLGFSVARHDSPVERNEGEIVEESSRTVQPLIDDSIPAKQMFDESDYKKALLDFRDGKREAACTTLTQAADSNSASIWIKKAQMFVSRKCSN